MTRLKSNADFRVCKRNDVSKYSNISSDQIIEMKGFYTSRKCPLKLRRIRSKDPETGKFIVILTNNFSWSAKTVAAVYKERWQIEIFFKTLKQNLKIKSFLGTSRNAVMIQIWIAMIAYLLLWNLQYLSRRNWTIQSLIRLIPVVLFSDKNIYDLLDDKPPERKIKLNPALQLELL
ncbi:MAG: transposase [Clostridiaceae bacterium]|nr:transposase [Clostridiaceae bacterium]